MLPGACALLHTHPALRRSSAVAGRSLCGLEQPYEASAGYSHRVADRLKGRHIHPIRTSHVRPARPTQFPEGYA